MSGAVVANISSPHPQFTLPPLPVGPDYAVRVFAVNARGSSGPYLLQGFSLKVAENRMGMYYEKKLYVKVNSEYMQ